MKTFHSQYHNEDILSLFTAETQTPNPYNLFPIDIAEDELLADAILIKAVR